MSKPAKLCIIFYLFTAFVNSAAYADIGSARDLLGHLDAGQYRELLAAGELSRRVEKGAPLKYLPQQPESAPIREWVVQTEPNFLYEYLQVISVEKNDDHLGFMFENLRDLNKLTEIPYFSRRNKTWNLLIDWIEVIRIDRGNQRSAAFPQTEKLTVKQEMRPFDPYQGELFYRKASSRFLFSMQNMESVSYRGIRAVRKENMATFILVIETSEGLLIYGAGGAAGGLPFGLFSDRLETAFIGRIEAFKTWGFNTAVNELKTSR